MPKSTHTVDEYLSPSFYNKHTKTRERGFESFEHEGKYYFCYYENSKVVLLSQGYTAASGRDNGIASVKKNMKLKKRFRFTDRDEGQFGFSLIAGNHQEIAISRDFGSHKSAENIAGLMNGSVKAKLKKPAPKKAVAKKPAPKKTASSVSTRTRSNEDNYKPLAFYQKHIESKADGISRFEGDDGLHYFTYNENKKIVLISEGYPTKAVRDTGAASVEKNRLIEARYKFRKLRNGKHDFKLFAGNHKEIARSVWYGSAAMAATGAAYLMGTRKRAVKPKATKSKTETIAKAAPIATLGVAAAAAPIRAKPPAKPVAKPVPKPVIAPKAPIAAVAPALALRPAGAVAPVAAAPIIKPAATATAAAPAALAAGASVAGGGVTGGAVGGAGGLRWLLWLIPLLLLLAFLLLGFKSCGDKAVRPVPAIVETIAPTPDPVVEPKVESVAPDPVLPEPVVEEPVVDPIIEPIVEPTPPPTPKPVEPKVVASNLSLMACSRSDNILFNVPQNMTPVSVTRLGTMPEFGDSHGLTPAEFYDKLTKRYLSRQYDQQYLDFLFRSMGYENGFKDATPQMFSNVTLAQGAKGVLGLGEFHGMQVSQLNVKLARDLEAFNIKSLNGQNVNFMKTCGNFMHVCQ